ncbi:MAG: hypothetical protein WEC35_06605 [Nitrosopumilaceae archaeon]
MNRLYSTKKGIGAGMVGGIMGGIVMLAPMMSMMPMMNLPSDLFPTLIGTIMGQAPQYASMTGIGFHFVASIIIGLIFGTAINSSKLSITSFKKGIGLGIATGAIAFAALFLPMMMTVFPPAMMNLMTMMNPGASKEMIMNQLQSMQPMILSGSIISHLIYGAVLGAITSLIVINWKLICSKCGMKMSRSEFDSHRGICKVK